MPDDRLIEYSKNTDFEIDTYYVIINTTNDVNIKK